jgi:SAM-dependent methyltransferase
VRRQPSSTTEYHAHVRDAEYNHPRLVEIYDVEGPWGPADDYFAALVNETPGARVLDLGCGTGRLTIALAIAGHRVTGVDPSAAALAAAQAKPAADRVVWIQGTASSAPAAAFDVAIMTGHAAQFLVGDDEWHGALRSLHGALSPHGRLAFHAYDPQSRVWERWTPDATRRALTLADGTQVTIWTEVTDRRGAVVCFSHHYELSNGETLRSDSSLCFRSEARLRQSVAGAGFTIERVSGGWHGQPVGAGDGELIVVARR